MTTARLLTALLVGIVFFVVFREHKRAVGFGLIAAAAVLINAKSKHV